MRHLTVNFKDLPKLVELTDDTGRSKFYQFQPVGKKKGFGMVMIGTPKELTELLKHKK